MVRSPFAHARIVRIDSQAAEDSVNVVEVFTGAELAEELGSLPNAWPITADQKAPAHPPIAVDRVAFAGDIVAVVVARSAADARDAAELVDVEYEELPAVLDLKEAAEDNVLAHPDLGTNKSALWRFDSGEAGTGGSADEAIAKAREDGIVIEREYRQQRLIPAFMEPRSVLVDPTGEQITMWSSTQIPHVLRFLAAAILGIPESKLRIVAPDVGGGFGGKLQTTPEEFITLVFGRRLGKPVKWTETRSESLVSAHHGRDQWQKITLAAEKDGTVTGLKVELLADMGAYLSLLAGGIPILGAFMYNAIYKFPSYQFNCQTVLTNKTWTDAYRGAGRPEATYAIERIMDELAAELGVDPLEIRAKNWITHEEFPFTSVAGLTYDSGNYEAATAQAKEMFEYDALRAEQAKRRASQRPGPARYRRLHVHGDVRVGALEAGRQPRVRRGWLGPRHGPDDGRPARSRCSPGSRPTARATRRRSARSWPTGSAWLSRTWRCCTATPRWQPAATTPMGQVTRGRRRGGAAGC